MLGKYAAHLHASRLFWPDFNDSFLWSAAPLDLFQEQKKVGETPKMTPAATWTTA